MNTNAWRKEIEQAASAAAVVEIVKRFVDGLDSSTLRSLPAECRPRAIGTTQDVAYWAFTFATAALAEEIPDSVHELSLVFAEASSRVAALALGSHRAAQLRTTVITPD